MYHVEVDFVNTPVLAPASGAPPVFNYQAFSWPEDRFLIGWDPWMGFGKQSELESHIVLYAEGIQLFLRGPHKESPNQMYDITGAEFFPSGYGRFVPKGGVITLEFLYSNTSSPGVPVGGQANARIFSVKV